jgi:hypothetical protein
MSAGRFCLFGRPSHRPARAHHFSSDCAHCAVEAPVLVTTGCRRRTWAANLIPSGHPCGEVLHSIFTSALRTPFASTLASTATVSTCRCRPPPLSLVAVQALRKGCHLPLITQRWVGARTDGHRSRETDFTEPPSPSFFLTVDCDHPCTSGPATTSKRTARAHSSPMSTPSSSATACLSCHRHPLRHRVPHCRSTALVSPFPPNRLPSVPHGPRVPHRYTFAAGRQDFANNARREEGDWNSLLQSCGPKRSSGPGHSYSARPCVPMEEAQWNSVNFLFYSD